MILCFLAYYLISIALIAIYNGMHFKVTFVEKPPICKQKQTSEFVELYLLLPVLTHERL